jgi:hypothetical protein
VSAPVDHEQLRRDLSDALKAIQRDHDVTGLDALAASLQTPPRPRTWSTAGCYRRVAEMPRNYSTLIWSLVQVIAKLERDVA